MDVQFAKIEGNTTPYYVTVALLAAFAIAGSQPPSTCISTASILSGMTNRVPWGLQIAMAIFYIGLSAGSLVVSGPLRRVRQDGVQAVRPDRRLPGHAVPDRGPALDLHRPGTDRPGLRRSPSPTSTRIDVLHQPGPVLGPHHDLRPLPVGPLQGKRDA